jgi:tRNA threonylcarbamoyladenosine biosynthesis protein TsaE
MEPFISRNPEDTQRLATEFAATLQGGELVELIGELGAGKTTFVRGVAAALGATARVKSPTFTVMNEYPVTHPTIKRIVHMDLYRMTNADHLSGLAMEDVRDAHTVVFIEWPDIFGKEVFVPDVRVKIDVTSETSRQITIA